MRVLFNDFKKQYQVNKTGVDKSIKKVLESGWYILGQEVLGFEKEFASYLGLKHAIGVGNGLDALSITLQGIGIKKDDEIITTSHSAVATALAIRAVGAKPIFIDIDKYFHIDAIKIENSITKKTRAILPVHLYGQPAEIKKIMAIAKKYKLLVIEDCAQAHGAEFSKKKVGSFGIAGCFSFYPTKNLGGFGDGGMIVTNNDDLAEKCRMIRNYGQKNRYEHPIYGINSRLDEIQAGILSYFLKNLQLNNNKRIEISKLYRKELSTIRQIKLPLQRVDVKHVYHLFVIEAEKRDQLQEFLKKNGIDTLIHYPIPIHKQKSFLEYNNLLLKNLEEKTGKILSLPIHPYLTKKEVLFVCNKIKEFYKN